MSGAGHGQGEQPLSAELVAVEGVRPLRHAVLRPGWPDEESVYRGDDQPTSAHAAVRDSKSHQVVAVGTVLAEAAPWAPDEPAWRIRGMATDPGCRSLGLGALVLGALITHVRTQGGGLVWCNARVAATSFYERAGFAGRDDLFDLPGIGVHRRMWARFEVWEPEGS